jgi:formylglycine-generating enzyme required for sulfatase activity
MARTLLRCSALALTIGAALSSCSSFREGPLDAASGTTTTDGGSQSGAAHGGKAGAGSGLGGEAMPGGEPQGGVPPDAPSGGQPQAGVGGDGDVVGPCEPGFAALEGQCRPAPASCKGLAATCEGNRNCCVAELVPGGQFKLGWDQSDTPTQDGVNVPGWQAKDTAPVISVSPYWLGVYEVTVGRFRRFVQTYDAWRKSGNPQDDEGAHAKVGASGWQHMWLAILAKDAAALEATLQGDKCAFPSWTHDPGENENRPIACVDWYTAYAFCMFDGGRLPTEVEWAFAASGGAEQRAFPWPPATSTALESSFAVFDRDESQLNSQPVGSTSEHVGRFNHRDLAGNVWEWTRDQCDTCKGAEIDSYDFTNCGADCIDLVGTSRYFRGGSWKYSSPTLRTAYRGGVAPGVRYDDLGFRCARNP